jgi:signal transduction histidine kinase
LPAEDNGDVRKRELQWVVPIGVAIAATGALLIVLWAAPPYRHDMGGTWTRPVLVAHLLSVFAAVAGGTFLIQRRPRNRCGYVGVLVGLVLGGWIASHFHLAIGSPTGWQFLITPALVWSLRPLLFWLVLAFPIGRLDRASRRLFVAFLTVAAVVFASTTVLTSDDSTYPLDAFRPATWTLLVTSTWWDVGALLWLSLILVIVQRRRLRFRGASARGMLNAAWFAALAATSADFILIATGPLRDLSWHGDRMTPFGAFVTLVDYLRWGGVVAILAIAAARWWPASVPSAASQLDIERVDSDATLRDALVHALGDSRADIALADGSGGWTDSFGHPRAVPAVATLVLHDGVPVAALELDESIAVHPALIDAAVTGLALQLDARRQTALAAAREHELRELARAVLDADDTARRKLERDLHDGAQQALVGLTLQSALHARNAEPGESSGHLADAIDNAREELLHIATGRPPALLAERGLDGAIGALVFTAGLPVRVTAEACDDLPDALQRAMWFTASEAIANVVKHAHASQLDLSIHRNATTVFLVVQDDGVGGVREPPAALAARVADVGGALSVESNGHGTTISATFRVADANEVRT